ncbi:MAG: ArnT family glycosyltransferase [Candidatus Limnocylindrales bacterium]
MTGQARRLPRTTTGRWLGALAIPESLRIPAILFVVAFVARVITALPFFAPGYPDSVYYLATAREIVAGHGFTMPYIWAFVDTGGHLPAIGTLPIPSNEHWMPLASIVEVPFIWLLGSTYLASCLPFWILAALGASITYLLGMDAGLGRGISIAAGLLMVMPGAAAGYMSQPDNFSLYLVLGVTAMWLCVRGAAGNPRAFALGGVVVGLAMLARTDGVLLGVPFVVAFALERWRRWRGSERGPVRISWGAAIVCFGLFLVVMAPWWIRDYSIFGSISPSSSSGRILWIRTYEQLFSVSDQTTPATFFAQGWGPLLTSRIGGLIVAIEVLAAQPLLIFLVPFCLVGVWLHRHDPAFHPWLVYGTTFLLFAGVVFAVHLPYGMALHSEMALVPQAYLLSVVGIGATVRWVAARRPHWDAPRATRTFTVTAIVLVWLVSGLSTGLLARAWGREADYRTALMAAHPIPSTDRLMSPDPGAYWYHWGIVGIPTPNDPLDVIREAAARYDVRWLAVEKDELVPALEPVLRGTVHPAWLSKPLAVVPEDPSATGPDAKLPKAELFAVCLSAGDTRCAP